MCRSGTGCLHEEHEVTRQRPHRLAHLFNCVCPLAECGHGTALSINKVRSRLCLSWESQPFLNGHCYALHHKLFCFLISLFISVSVCLDLSMWLDTPEVIRGSWAPGTGITDVCEPANTDAGNRVQFPTGASRVLTTELSHQWTDRSFIGTTITQNHCVQINDTATFQVVRLTQLKWTHTLCTVHFTSRENKEYSVVNEMKRTVL